MTGSAAAAPIIAILTQVNQLINKPTNRQIIKAINQSLNQKMIAQSVFSKLFN